MTWQSKIRSTQPSAPVYRQLSLSLKPFHPSRHYQDYVRRGTHDITSSERVVPNHFHATRDSHRRNSERSTACCRFSCCFFLIVSHPVDTWVIDNAFRALVTGEMETPKRKEVGDYTTLLLQNLWNRNRSKKRSTTKYTTMTISKLARCCTLPLQAELKETTIHRRK